MDGQVVASAPIKIQPAFFSLSGEGANVGRDRGQPVSSDYESPFPLTGATLDHVTLTVS